MAELKSLISKQVGKLKKSTSLTAENVSKWVDDVSDTLKKLYNEKTEAFQRNLQKQVDKLKKNMKSTSKKSSTEKALDEMELKPDDLLVAIDNFNRNHETQSVLIKDINDLNQVNFELSKKLGNIE
jgi:hypothetical protein